jgi:hypothetical protein
MSHHGAKSVQNLERNDIHRVAHVLDSLNLRPRVLWLFGTMKYEAKDRKIQIPETIRLCFEQPQNDVSFKDMQKVLREWVTRLTGLFDHGGENYRKHTDLPRYMSLPGRENHRGTLLFGCPWICQS